MAVGWVSLHSTRGPRAPGGAGRKQGKAQNTHGQREGKRHARLGELLLKDWHDLRLARLHPVQPRVECLLVLCPGDDRGVADDEALVVAQEERGRGDGPSREEVTCPTRAGRSAATGVRQQRASLLVRVLLRLGLLRPRSGLTSHPRVGRHGVGVCGVSEDLDEDEAVVAQDRGEALENAAVVAAVLEALDRDNPVKEDNSRLVVAIVLGALCLAVTMARSGLLADAAANSAEVESRALLLAKGIDVEAKGKEVAQAVESELES